MSLSSDYERVLASLDRPVDPAQLGAALLTALAERYESVHGECVLLQFEQSGAVYLFDLASSAGLFHDDRTVAAWIMTPKSIARRDTAYRGVSQWLPVRQRPQSTGDISSLTCLVGSSGRTSSGKTAR